MRRLLRWLAWDAEGRAHRRKLRQARRWWRGHLRDTYGKGSQRG